MEITQAGTKIEEEILDPPDFPLYPRADCGDAITTGDPVTQRKGYVKSGFPSKSTQISIGSASQGIIVFSLTIVK